MWASCDSWAQAWRPNLTLMAHFCELICTIHFLYFICRLFTMRKRDQLERVLCKISSMNGKEYCKDFVDHLLSNSSLSHTNQRSSAGKDGDKKDDKNGDKNATFFSLFNPKRPRFLLMTLIVCWIWLVRWVVRWKFCKVSGGTWKHARYLANRWILTGSL